MRHGEEPEVSRPGSKQASIHLIRAFLLQPFVRFLEQRGCPVERHLRKAHLSPALSEDPYGAVPVLPAFAFGEMASRAEGIDHLGLRVGEAIGIDDLGTYRVLLGRSRNLHEYIQSAIRHVGSIATDVFFELEVQRGRACLSLGTVIQSPSRLTSHLFALTVTFKLIRTLAPGWRPSDVVLPLGSPDELAALSRDFEHVRIDPSAPAASFTFPASFLTLPTVATDDSRGEADLSSLGAGDFPRAVRALVEHLLPGGDAGLHAAADAAGMPARTFQRRLSECGQTYRDVVQAARIDSAERLLLKDLRPVSDIAYSLGYTAPANFTRAFRRLNGVTPSVYRTQHMERTKRPRGAAVGR